MLGFTSFYPTTLLAAVKTMVQLKYFGDSRDYFKYDLITSILSGVRMNSYVFVPMLTSHRDDNEGNKTPKYINGKSDSLLSFIKDRRAKSKDLNHWEEWIGKFKIKYETVNPVNATIFNDTQRSEYWQTFLNYLKNEGALIFIDPDTGLESGSEAYLKKKGREKYILNEEVALLCKLLDASSLLMIYQHLPKNKHIHKESVNKKLSQLQSSSNGTLVCAYREDDLAFLFIAKDRSLFDGLCKILSDYHDKSEHDYKSLHIMSN